MSINSRIYLKPGVKFSSRFRGTFALEGNKYTETLEFADWITDIGSTLTYECQFENDMWIMTGPVLEEGEEEAPWQLREEWKKIE